jgi:hypothetical protein
MLRTHVHIIILTAVKSINYLVFLITYSLFLYCFILNLNAVISSRYADTLNWGSFHKNSIHINKYVKLFFVVEF